jgi:hypothetical protein
LYFSLQNSSLKLAERGWKVWEFSHMFI